MIKVSNLCYSSADKVILNNVNIEIEPGQITAILGPNGAGKSTLLKCLTSALSPQQGAITLDDRPLHSYSLRQLSKKRAILSQSNAINFPFTALEIALMGRNPHIDKKESAFDHEVVEQTLKKMDAWHLKDRVYPTLSGGEQQRVHLARVLAQIWGHQNSYLFLDEPTSALDLKHQYELLECIKLLCKTDNLAVVAVMHDINLAYHFTDNTIFIKQGQAVMSGNSRQVINANNISECYNLPQRHAARHFSLAPTAAGFA